jgi:hypothetical protein
VEYNEQYPSREFESRGFWIAQELTQLKNDNRLMLDQMNRLTELVTDLKVQVAEKVDKGDFFEKIDTLRERSEDRSGAVIEVLKILGASIGAAVSALTGAKLLS